MLQGANDRGADGDDAAALAKGAVERFGCRGGQGVALAVEMDVGDALDAERRECAQANVQGQARDLNTLGGDLVLEFGRKVQAGGGRGYGSAFARVNGLVALAIILLIAAVNVGRQRDVADAIEGSVEIVDRLEAEEAVAVLAAFEDFGLEFDGAGWRGEHENLADGDFASGTDERAPAVIPGRLGEHDFNTAGGRLATPATKTCRWGPRNLVFAAQRASGVEARGDHAAVVENQQISGMEQRGKFGKV